MANIFEAYSQQKEELRQVCLQAREYSWLSEEEVQGMLAKLDSEILTIGVIGQMKAGKSTFLNAFVFENDVLPSATTPMTAALSVITYGEVEGLEVEFYTEKEWIELKMTAQRTLDESASELEKSKVQAAQELVSKASALGSSITTYLGTKRDDSLQNLIDYVGADGKFVSITKSVKIFYPKEYLKGVEIVDTPGFNDPIVSREERTREFLSKADVVLMMLYAGRPFDATDREIIFKHVARCGMGKLVIGINKYDIPYSSGETEEEIKAYVMKEIKEACKDCTDDTLRSLLLEAEPIPISAEMALLSTLPLSYVDDTERYKYAWDRHTSTFEVSTQAELREKSLFSTLSERVLDIILKEKGEILFAKPRNTIKAAIRTAQQELSADLFKARDMLKSLSMPDVELEEKQANIEKIQKRFKKGLNSHTDEFEEQLVTLRNKYRQQFEDAIDAACYKAKGIVNSASYWDKSFVDKVNEVFFGLTERTIPRLGRALDREFSAKIIGLVRNITTDAERLLDRWLPDIDSVDLKRELLALGSGQSQSEDNNLSEDSDSIFDVLLMLLGTPFQIMDYLLLGTSGKKEEFRNEINRFQGSIDVDQILSEIVVLDGFMDKVHDLIFVNFLNPMEENIRQIQSDKVGREQMKQEVELLINDLEAKEQQLKEKIASFNI